MDQTPQSLRARWERLQAERRRIEAELHQVERQLHGGDAAGPSEPPEPPPPVRRLIRWFDRGSDELVGSAPIRGLPLRELQAMFGRPEDDPMYDCYPVTAVQASQLQAHVDVPIDLAHHDYFVEADAAG